MKLVRFSGLLAGLLLCASVVADDELAARLGETLKKALPDATITSVSRSPIPGIYEVMLGPSVIYMTGDGRFAIKGDVFDLQALENLTATRRAAARVEAFESVGSETMIEFAPVSGKTLRTLYVFTDIDCAYCRKMHREIKKLTDAGISVRYLAWPRAGLSGESFDKAVSVWCSKDRNVALTAAKAGKKIKSTTCDNPVKEHFHLGELMGVKGTPAVFLDTGDQLGGYIPAHELLELFASGEI